MQDQHKQSLRCCKCMMRGRHRRTSTAPPGPQTIRDEPCHILPRRSPSQVPMISPRATPPPPTKKPPECGSVELSRRFPPPSPPLSGQVDPFDFAGGEKKNVGEECAEPRVLISRCHGPAFPSPQSRDHTTAYRCREARCQSAPLPGAAASASLPGLRPSASAFSNKSEPFQMFRDQ